MMRLHAAQIRGGQRRLLDKPTRLYCCRDKPRARICAHDHCVASGVRLRSLAGGRAAVPVVGGRDVGGFANAVGADFATEGQHPLAVIIAPHIEIMMLCRAAVLVLDPRRARAAMPAIAYGGDAVRVMAHAAGKLAKADIGHIAAAHRCQPVAHQPVDARVVMRQPPHGVQVAGLGDQGKRLVPVEEGADLRQRGGRAIA